MTRTTPEIAPPLQTAAPQQREDILLPIYVLACNRSNKRRIFSEIGFRSWRSPAESRNPTIRPPWPNNTFEIPMESNIYNLCIRN
ncbi:hypothetical protein AVEN_73741-1 [Araneus ventricosus]|uniref:Uncharacterized protein n=1 Tax=Araneus ventricosus TaxID=182803 RepID=A0A4Y2N7Q7_ARAVE|nr:hypothetical protein AVEN_73741-1 [Araneus ventricosus]